MQYDKVLMNGMVADAWVIDLQYVQIFGKNRLHEAVNINECAIRADILREGILIVFRSGTSMHSKEC